MKPLFLFLNALLFVFYSLGVQAQFQIGDWKVDSIIDLAVQERPYQVLGAECDAQGHLFLALRFLDAFKAGGNAYLDLSYQQLAPSTDDDKGDGVLLKYDTTGGLQWVTAFQQKGDLHFDGFEVDEGGNSYLLFYYEGKVHINFNAYQGFDDPMEEGYALLKLNAAGKLVWEKRFQKGGNRSQRPHLALHQKQLYICTGFSEFVRMQGEELKQEAEGVYTALLRLDTSGTLEALQLLETQPEAKEQAAPFFAPYDLAVDATGRPLLKILYEGTHQPAGTGLVDTTAAMEEALLQLSAQGKVNWCRPLYGVANSRMLPSNEGFFLWGQTQKERVRLGSKSKEQLKDATVGNLYFSHWSEAGKLEWLQAPFQGFELKPLATVYEQQLQLVLGQLRPKSREQAFFQESVLDISQNYLLQSENSGALSPLQALPPNLESAFLIRTEHFYWFGGLYEGQSEEETLRSLRLYLLKKSD